MLICVVLAVLLAVFTVGYTFAWFADYASIEISLYAEEDGGYFESGDGKSEETAYEIKTYKHLYNLAWLQNLGKFDDGVYYFKLSADINMYVNGAYYVIPPIGNDESPFNGVFNGNGYTIYNLVVSTDKNKLSNTDAARADSYNFSQYVGMFGNTGTSSNIKNFILYNPIVEVASENTSYSSASSACCGLAIGYVANKASSIGVVGGYLCVNKDGYSTYNSILGDKSNSITTSVTGGYTTTTGSGSGTGTSFGGSVDIRSIMYRMYYIDKYSTANGGSWTTPSISFGGLENGSDSSYPNSGSYMSLIVSNDITDDYYKSYASEAVDTNNIGYYTGNEAKILPKQTYAQLLASDCYINGSSTATGSSGNVSSSYIGKLTDVNIYEFVDSGYTFSVQVKTDMDSNVKSDVLELLNQDLVYTITFSGQVDQNNWVTINNATVAGEKYDEINVPPKSLWFTPQEDGMAKIVFLTMNDCLRNISLYKINRTSKGSNDHDFYSETVSGHVSIEQITKVYKFTDSYGNVTYEYNPTTTTGGTCIYSYDWTWNSGYFTDMVFYLEIPVYAGTEYAFGAVNSKEAYVLYMDIGQNGTASSTTQSDGKYSTDYDISAIDFIYKGVTISQTSFNFEVKNDEYTASSTRITFSAATGDSATIVMGFYRNENGYYSSTDTENSSYTITVTYYVSVYGVPSGSYSKAYLSVDSTLSGLDILTLTPVSE